MPRGLVAMARSGGHCPLRVSGGILCSERGQSRDAFQAIPLEETSPRCNKDVKVDSKRSLTYRWDPNHDPNMPVKAQTLGHPFYYYTPVFRRDVLWYGDVRPGLRPSVRSPSARFPHFSPTCLDILSWNFAHDFVLMYYRSSMSVITLRQFLKELCLFVDLEYRKYSFLYFSPTCFDILSWNFAHDFVLMHYRARLSVVTLRQFLKELCLFVNLEYRKYTVFRSFLLHALTNWAEILHMTLF